MIGSEWFNYSKFKKALIMPLPGLVVSKKWSFLNEWALTDRLYQSYKKLPSGKFKLVKMRVMSHDVKNGLSTVNQTAFLRAAWRY